MIFTHPHTEGPGVWGHREEIHNGRRRSARNMCEVEIYAEFAPPGEWTSKLKLFLGEEGRFGRLWWIFRVSRVWLHRELSMAPGLYLHYKEVNLTLTLVTYRQKNLLYGRPWWQKQSSWWCSTIDASFRQGRHKREMVCTLWKYGFKPTERDFARFSFLWKNFVFYFLGRRFSKHAPKISSGLKVWQLKGKYQRGGCKTFFERE